MHENEHALFSENEPPYNNVNGVAVLKPDLLVEVYHLALETAKKPKQRNKYKRILAAIEKKLPVVKE